MTSSEREYDEQLKRTLDVNDVVHIVLYEKLRRLYDDGIVTPRADKDFKITRKPRGSNGYFEALDTNDPRALPIGFYTWMVAYVVSDGEEVTVTACESYLS